MTNIIGINLTPRERQSLWNSMSTLRNILTNDKFNKNLRETRIYRILLKEYTLGTSY